MNRIPALVTKFGQLNRMGSEILRTHNHLNNLPLDDFTKKIHCEQEKRIQAFGELADTVKDDWKKSADDMNKFWTGWS